MDKERPTTVRISRPVRVTSADRDSSSTRTNSGNNSSDPFASNGGEVADMFSDLVIQEYVTEERLVEASGEEDLEKVEYIELQADTSKNSLGRIGQLLPNLKELRLSGSNISTIRDLGTSLRNVTVLWLAKCNLSDLNGISMMPSLQELYLAFNHISMCAPLSICENLQIIDLEGNNISDISQVEFLGLLPSLSSLTLEGNPFINSCKSVKVYRERVFQALPTLSSLDDVPIGAEVNESELSSSDSLLISKLLKKRVEDSSALQDSIRPSTARPLTANLGKRPTTTASSTTATKSNDQATDTSSSLTMMGADVVFQGAPLLALMARRNKQQQSEHGNVPQMSSEVVLEELFRAVGLDDDVDSADIYDCTDPFAGKSRGEVIEELKSWRRKFAAAAKDKQQVEEEDQTGEGQRQGQGERKRRIPKKPKHSKRRPETARPSVGRRRKHLVDDNVSSEQHKDKEQQRVVANRTSKSAVMRSPMTKALSVEEGTARHQIVPRPPPSSSSSSKGRRMPIRPQTATTTADYRRRRILSSSSQQSSTTPSKTTPSTTTHTPKPPSAKRSLPKPPAANK
eukprot:m.24857 g.24857  ORF g.24857 m.24857 type:complete len:571 (-) comp9142_c0_seq1:19-1731(-)